MERSPSPRRRIAGGEGMACREGDVRVCDDQSAGRRRAMDGWSVNSGLVLVVYPVNCYIVPAVATASTVRMTGWFTYIRSRHKHARFASGSYWRIQEGKKRGKKRGGGEGLLGRPSSMPNVPSIPLSPPLPHNYIWKTIVQTCMHASCMPKCLAQHYGRRTHAYQGAITVQIV